MATPFHDTVRQAVADAMTAAFAAAVPAIAVPLKLQDAFVPSNLDRPCLVATFDAGADAVVATNSGSDYRRYPVALIYCSVDPDKDDGAGVPIGGRLTAVREAILAAFNQKRLPSATPPLDTVYLCTYDPSGPIVDLGLISQLKTQCTISVYARRPRGG